MTDIFTAELAIALETADSICVDGAEARVFVTPGKPFVQLRLFDATNPRLPLSKGQFLVDPNQIVGFINGAGEIYDSLGFSHELILCKDRRLTSQDIKQVIQAMDEAATGPAPLGS